MPAPDDDDEIRDRLIQVGIDLLHQRGVHVGVHHIRLSEVVRVAGLTTGAAYRRWETQEDYHRDLAVTAIGWRISGSIEGTLAAIRVLVESGAPLHEVLRVGAEANLHKLPDDAGFLASLALRGAAPTDPQLAEASRRRQAEAVTEYARLYSAVLIAYRRRMRPPFTLELLAQALGALSEGFASHAPYEPDHPRFPLQLPPEDGQPDGPVQEWTLLGAAALAIVEGFTEPLPPDGSEPPRP